MISVKLDLPDEFRPKAAFAIKALLSPFKTEVYFGDGQRQEGSNGVNIYYGLHPEKHANDYTLCIRAVPETCAWFDTPRFFLADDCFEDNSFATSVKLLFGKPGIDGNILEGDVVASAFYFLSDWQDHVPDGRDPHGRLSYERTLQAQLNSPMRPFVNEYADYLRDAINIKIGKELERRTWSGAQIAGVITHDLDRIRKKYPGTWIREFVELPFLNPHDQPIKTRAKRFGMAFLDFFNPKDAYRESIRKMLRFEMELGARPTVLLKSIIQKHKNDARDYLDDPFVKEIISLVEQAGGEMGLHSSYEAGYDGGLFKKELERFHQKTGLKPLSHRFHYIRYRPGDAFKILEENSINTDSSMGWADMAGCRTGFVHPHPVFDVTNNRPLTLLQVPMMLMDMQLFNRMGLTIDESLDIARKQVDIACRYHGLVVWNFHHLVYDKSEAGDCDILFENSLNYLNSKKPTYLTLGEINDTNQ